MVWNNCCKGLKECSLDIKIPEIYHKTLKVKVRDWLRNRALFVSASLFAAFLDLQQYVSSIFIPDFDTADNVI